jgi:hypothetical protein
MIGAATKLAHTSCMMALVWTTWLAQRSREPRAPAWSHAGAALAFAVAFFIRPVTAIGIGLPLIVWWTLGAWTLEGKERGRAVVAFAVPAAAMAALFFAVNLIQNGSVLTVAYQQVVTYAQENGYRFTGTMKGLQVGSLGRGMATVATGTLRMSYSLFGWPIGFLFMIVAGTSPAARIGWAMCVSFLAVNLIVNTPGIDSFGPTHWVEFGWPVILLSVLGMRTLWRWLGAGQKSTAGPAGLQWLPAGIAAAFILASLCGYTPVRLAALQRMAASINLPTKAAEREGLSNAVVFYIRPWVLQKDIAPTRHFVFWRPNNDPGLKNDILWVNHLTVEHDKLLMEYFPDRTGYVMIWHKGKPVFQPIDRLGPGSIPKGLIGGTEEIDIDLTEHPSSAR